MRILIKLLMKFLLMVAVALVMGSGLKHGTRFITGGSGVPGAPDSQVSAEESDLLSTVFQSALSLLSGKASRSELAGDLSDKLYGQRGNSAEMAELGIELVKAKPGPSPLGPGAIPADAQPDEKSPEKDAKSPEKPGSETDGPGTATPPVTRTARRPAAPRLGPELISGKSQSALTELWRRMKRYAVELGLIPVVFLGMTLVSRRRKRKREEALLPDFVAVLPEADTETNEMEHPVHSLTDEEFALLVAVIYQRQGYRVSLPAGLGGGRSGDFKLSRKSERLLVQCQKMNVDHRVPVERVRELHDAMTDASATGALYVASCGFTWDARHFAKTRRIKLINAKTLDALLTAARETPEENLLEIAPWVPKFMTKVELTTPLCPACEVEMEKIMEGNGSIWLCSQRPECRGRRSERKYRKAPRTPAQDATINASTAEAPQPAPAIVAPARHEPGLQHRSQPPAPRVAIGQEEIEAIGSIPPAFTGRQEIQLPATPPTPPKPVPSPPRSEGLGRSAAPGSTPPPAERRRGFVLPENQPAKPKPAPSPARVAGTGRSTDAGSTPPPAEKRRGFVLPENKPATPKPAPSPARSEGTGKSTDAGSAPPPAERRRGFVLAESQPATPRPAPSPARVAGNGRSTDAGSSPPPAERRRGFVLAENQPAKPRSAPSPARSEGTGRSAAPNSTPPPAERRRGFVLQETQPAKPKSARAAA
jgi:hypothetical protein